MSSQTLDSCFQYVIGLANTDCECFTDDAPADYDVSDSGLYINGLEGFNLDAAKSTEGCEETLWDIMDAERAAAVADAKNDLLSCLRTKTKQRRAGFRGQIGEAHKMSKNIEAKNSYHGFRLAFANVQGGFIRIKGIGAAFAFTGSKTLKIYDNTSDEILHTIVLATEADKLKWNPLTDVIELPIAAPKAYKYLVLDFIYEPTSGQSFRDTKITCMSCGGEKPVYNIDKPQFLTRTPKAYGWTPYCIAAGIKGNDFSKRQAWTTSNETQGLVLDVELGCDAEKTICSDSLDYKSSEIALALAYAIRYRAGARIYNKILNGGNINRYTTASAEDIAALRDQWQGAYSDRIYNFLCPEMARADYLNQNSDCLTCNDEYAATRKGLLI